MLCIKIISLFWKNFWRQLTISEDLMDSSFCSSIVRPNEAPASHKISRWHWSITPLRVCWNFPPCLKVTLNADGAVGARHNLQWWLKLFLFGKLSPYVYPVMGFLGSFSYIAPWKQMSWVFAVTHWVQYIVWLIPLISQ